MMREDQQAPQFTIRVYGLLVRSIEGERHVLVADEIIKGRRITKFPGGGVEYGEGLKDCLVREIREELGVDAFDLQHFYTTDFFQQSVFHTRPMQVISVYYTFQITDPTALPVMASPFDYSKEGQKEGFRWLGLSTATEDDLTLPIDRVVLSMLQKE
jgi:8-oxo-dGTP pyrophosphatase MutT (NUDIX family)